MALIQKPTKSLLKDENFCSRGRGHSVWTPTVCLLWNLGSIVYMWNFFSVIAFQQTLVSKTIYLTAPTTVWVGWIPFSKPDPKFFKLKIRCFWQIRQLCWYQTRQYTYKNVYTGFILTTTAETGWTIRLWSRLRRGLPETPIVNKIGRSFWGVAKSISAVNLRQKTVL